MQILREGEERQDFKLKAHNTSDCKLFSVREVDLQVLLCAMLNLNICVQHRYNYIHVTDQKTNA